MMSYDKRLDFMMKDIVRREITHIYAAREIALKEMLGHWVSELEPSQVLQQQSFGSFDRLVGLAYAGDPLGQVIIHAPEGTP